MTIKTMIGRCYLTRSVKSYQGKHEYTLYTKASGNARNPLRFDRATKKWKRNIQNSVLNLEELGNAVVVLDESAKRVKILAACGKVGWISRYYLKDEVVNYNPSQATLQECIKRLVNLVCTVGDVGIQKELVAIVTTLRTVKEMK